MNAKRKVIHTEMQALTRSSRRRGKIVLAVYVVLVVASHLYHPLGERAGDADGTLNDRASVEIPMLDHRAEPIAGRSVRVVFQQWGPNAPADKLPVLLMHGAPGSGENFNELAPLLANDGREILAPDLLGFGESGMGPDTSYRVQAHYMFAFLDAMGVDRVHLVGWSNGGGVGIRMSDLDPDRVASLTMLASVGAQETEGSGSYFFEHFKYGAGYVLLGYLPELIPHFGVLGTFEERVGWLGSFWDSDQRQLTKIMPTITTPTLIVQGRHDFLVAPWAAERHHELMPTSRLIMLDASHFLPFMQKDETAGYLHAFFDRHEHPGVAPETDYLNLEPRRIRHGADAAVHWIGARFRALPWWAQLIAIMVMVRWWAYGALVVTMILVSLLDVDFGIAIVGMMIGRGWWLGRSAGILDRPFTRWGWVRGVLYIVTVFITGLIAAPWVLGMTQTYGLMGFVMSAGVFLIALRIKRLVVTWEGRQRIKAGVDRIMHHEYWAMWIIYLPVLWWGLKRILAGKGIRALGAVNPGYADDGGVQGESKHEINARLGDDPAVLKCVLVEPDNDLDRRIAQAMGVIESDEMLGGLPVICKPDVGERGRRVQLARTLDDVADYCRSQRDAFVLQRFHPGACEVGVLWVREPQSITDPSKNRADGQIYAVTVKHFPTVIGNSRRTLRRLILKDRRHRRQAAMFFDRLGDSIYSVPDEVETISLGLVGNHAQGAKFTDGARLITPALSARIGAIFDGFSDEHGRGFDIGRFDLRCDSLEALAQGEGFGIVELNGVSSEPTNLYDPARSIFWAWGVLLGYWKQVGALSAARIETGTGEPIDKATWKRMKRTLVRVMVREG